MNNPLLDYVDDRWQSLPWAKVGHLVLRSGPLRDALRLLALRGPEDFEPVQENHER